MTTEATCGCGGTVPADAAWCPRCFARRPVESLAPAVLGEAVGHRAFGSAGGEPGSPGFGSTAPQAPPGNRRATTSRFAKTEASFGLTGRIVFTILLLLPLAWFIYLATQLIGIGGIVVYGGIICPWALRDLWKHPGRG